MKLSEEIRLAYLQLKREVYYDTSNLFLRESIAEFEKNNFHNVISESIQRIESYLGDPDSESTWFLKEIDTIDTLLLPKKIQYHGKKSENLISNVREQDKYEVEDIFFYFSGSIPLHIFSILWCRLVGKILDEKLTADCYGNRINVVYEASDENTNQINLFKTYFRQYGIWRDKAVEEGLHQLEQNQNVLLIALDLKQCYHRLEANWDSIEEEIVKITSGQRQHILLNLNNGLKKIHEKYHDKIRAFIENTLFRHDFEKGTLSQGDDLPIGLPVGLYSSGIIANWELTKLDDAITKLLRPIYYGRYVDDLLIVLNVPKLNIHNKSTSNLIQEFLVNTEILANVTDKIDDEHLDKENSREVCDREVTYRVKDYSYLHVQSSKTIVHYYQHDHSWAGLKEFKEEIRKRSSEFRFLPAEEEYKNLSDEAYDLQYNGSLYKFRSLIGITENQNKLNQFIYKQQLKAWLCPKQLQSQTIRDLFLFFRGTNILNYMRSWEKIFTLLAITKKKGDFHRYKETIDKTIKKLEYPCYDKQTSKTKSPHDKDFCDEISKKMRENSKHYMLIAIAMAMGYLSPIDRSNYISEHSFIRLSNWFRSTLLLRHQNMFWPLLDYTDYDGSLSILNFADLSKLTGLDNNKVQNATRYIHPDEKILLWVFVNILKLGQQKGGHTDQTPFYSSERPFLVGNCEAKKRGNENSNSFNSVLDELGITTKPQKLEDPKANKTSFPVYTLDFLFTEDPCEDPDQLCIGIANVKINALRVRQCMKSNTPLLDNFKKQKELFDLINEAESDPKCDLVVFPEVYLPLGWLPFMAAQSRKRQVGFIFGLEHINIGKHSLNLVATLLPFKDKKGFSKLYASLRLKNHYSPMEAYELSRLSLERPNLPFLYEKFHWHGTVFTVFNCFELTDILHRGLFRSDIDLLAAVEYNKDVNYYSNILEAVARDVHCFAVQANTSDYGDSRLIAPKSTEEMNFVRIKGGENSVLIKANLPISDLRDFQIRKYSPTDKRYKPTPAGFGHTKVRNRK